MSAPAAYPPPAQLLAAPQDPLWVALGAAAVVVLVLAVLYPDRPVGVKYVPGVPAAPGSWPLIGNWRMVWKAMRQLNRRGLDEMLQGQRDVGTGGKPYALHIPFALGSRTTILNRPEYLQWIQGSKTHFPMYIKGTPFRACLADLLEEGIFVADGESWKRQRKLASRVFSVNNFRTHVQDTVHHDISVFLKLANDISSRRAQVNLPDIFFRFTLDTFGIMAFGADLECLPTTMDGLKTQVPFAVAFDHAQFVASQRFVNPFWKFTEKFTRAGREMRHSLHVIRHTCLDIIDQRLAKQATGTFQGVQGKEGKDLLQLFMDQGLQREDLLPVVLNFIIAGRDTTAQGLTWCLFLLHSAPEVVRKLRKEVAQVLGEGEDQRLMEYDDLKSMPYTQAVFLETLRLQPPVARNLKYATESNIIRPYAQEKLVGGGSDGGLARGEEDPYGTGAVPSGPLPDVYIQKGTTVLFSDYVMARMPEVWGPDCESYRPERFLHEDGTLKTFSPYVFHAFNAGPRLCLGQTLAMYEGCVMLSALLGQFEVRMDEEALARNPPYYSESLTLPMVNPYSVSLVKRML